MILVLATRNAGKVREMQALLAGLPVEVRSLGDYPDVPEVEESGSTFAENAELKARAVAAHTGELALADDSGIEVDALDGAPGVRSARFAGADASDEERNARLLELLEGVPPERRTARYVAAVTLAGPDGRAETVTGTCEGQIALAPRGTGGFGYDPIFLLPDRGLTAAEISPEEKNSISHRGQAVRKARDVLERWLASCEEHARDAEVGTRRP